MPKLTVYPLSNAFVSAASATTNFGNSNSLFTGQVGTNAYKFYIKFDLSALPSGIQISSIAANLYLYVYRKDNTTGADTVTIQALDKDFIEDNVTNSTTFTPVAIPDASTKDIAVVDLNNFITIPLPLTVTGWYNNSLANYGLVISGPATADALIGFLSNHNSDITTIPRLEIIYTVSYSPIYSITAKTAETIQPTETGANSAVYDISNTFGGTYIITNTLSKKCTVQLQCSSDGTTFEKAGSSYTLVQNETYTLNASVAMKNIRVLLTGTGFKSSDLVTVQLFTKQ